MMKTHKKILIVISVLVLAACGKKDGGGGSQVPTSQADLAFLSAQDFSSNSDSKLTNLLTQTFGSTAGSSMRDFYEQRISQTLTLEQWYQSQFYLQDGRSVPELAGLNGPLPDNNFWAFNPSMYIWLAGVYYNSATQMQIGPITVPFTSSQKGVMVISDRMNNRQDMAEVAHFRLTTMLHEARHSDCNTGVANSIKGSASSQSFDEAVTKTSEECGNQHGKCSGLYESSLKDKIACDKNPWGAYYIDFLYSSAAMSILPEGRERDVMRANAIDSLTRMEYDFQNMLANDQQPVITHQGVLSFGKERVAND